MHVNVETQMPYAVS